MFELTPYERRHQRALFNPFRDMENFEKNFWGDMAATDFKTDIKDNGKEYVLEAELPGFKKEDIHVDIEDGYMTISAERSNETEKKDDKGNFVRRERSYGSFSRSFDVSSVKTEDITGEYKEMCEDDFRGILTLGGTILGTKRTPFKLMRVVEDDNIDKVAAMKKTYKAAKLDCLLCLGGNGTHKTANLLSQEGLNIIGLPKTIDNDIYGTDVTFGFHTAVDIATDVIDRIHTTAGSHSRVMCIEIMGNKAGWLTLYSGIAGGADIILLPELPYDIDRVCEAVERRAKKGSNFSILAVAEGAINTEEARMKRKDWMAKRAEAGLGTTATNRIAQAVQKKTGMETRVCIPGHMQRGGSPSAYDRVLATQFGSYAAQLVEVERYGVTVAMVNRRVTENRLADIAGKTRNVPENCELLSVARRMGVCLG